MTLRWIHTKAFRPWFWGLESSLVCGPHYGSELSLKIFFFSFQKVNKFSRNLVFDWRQKQATNYGARVLHSSALTSTLLVRISSYGKSLATLAIISDSLLIDSDTVFQLGGYFFNLTINSWSISILFLKYLKGAWQMSVVWRMLL